LIINQSVDDVKISAASSLQTGLGTIRSRSLAHSIRLQPRRAAFMAPMLWRLRAFPDFCEPCLPSPVEQPPAGNGHDGPDASRSSSRHWARLKSPRAWSMGSRLERTKGNGWCS